MKYNLGNMKDLIDKLRMNLEIDRLRQAGLNNSQLAEVFYKIFNPDNLSRLGLPTLASPKGSPVRKRNFEILMKYYGINCNEDYYPKKLEREYNLSSSSIIELIFNFETRINRKQRFPISIKSYEVESYSPVLKKEIYYQCLEKVLSKNQ